MRDPGPARMHGEAGRLVEDQHLVVAIEEAVLHGGTLNRIEPAWNLHFVHDMFQFGNGMEALMDDTEEAPRWERKGKPWLDEEDRQLYDSFVAGQALDAIALQHQRSGGGIRSRLRRLGLIDDYGVVVDPPPDFAPPERRRVPRPDSGDGMKLIFSVTTGDGWQVQLKSNRTFDEPLVDRLASMLKGTIEDCAPSQ